MGTTHLLHTNLYCHENSLMDFGLGILDFGLFKSKI
jgi:hypothetical protein